MKDRIDVNKKQSISLFKISIFVLFILIFFSLPNSVVADVPDIISVEPWTSGTETVLNITIRHSSPTTNHYIDVIQVEIDSVVNNVQLNPQSENPFVVQYNMGELTTEPSFRVRAHCNLHGWGGWSSSQIIPEFSSILTLIFASLILVISIFITKNLRNTNFKLN